MGTFKHSYSDRESSLCDCAFCLFFFEHINIIIIQHATTWLKVFIEFKLVSVRVVMQAILATSDVDHTKDLFKCSTLGLVLRALKLFFRIHLGEHLGSHISKLL